MGLSMALAALALSVSAGFACDHESRAADAKDAKDAKGAVANGQTKGCDMPCCAHAEAAAADGAVAAQTGEKPCAAHDAKGCPKKAAAAVAAKSDATKEAAGNQAAKPATQPAADPGTRR
jgi:hypothetical protein